MSRTLMLLAALTAASAAAVQAQSPCAFLCAPAFVAQPGLIVTNAISPPDGASSKTDFNVRFTTVVPTFAPRVSLVALFQWQPSEALNFPAIVYGGAIALVRPQDTGGWLDVGFDPLAVYSPAPFANKKVYNTKLDLEGALGVHAFKGLPADNYFHSASVYGLVDYIATGLGSGADHWVLLTGLTLPIAPWPSSNTGRATAAR